MAIALDTSGTISGTSSASGSYTCTGSNLCLVVAVRFFGNSAASGTFNPTATYNGVSMTRVVNLSDPVGLGDQVALFLLTGAASGANTLAVSPGNSSGVVSFTDAAAASYTGVASAGQPDASNSSTTTVSAFANVSLAATSVTDNCWFVLGSGAQSAFNASTNATLRQQTSTVFAGIWDSNGPKTPAGSFTMSLNNPAAANRNIGLGIIALSPATSTPGNALFLSANF